jgi:heat shock protein HspQ
MTHESDTEESIVNYLAHEGVSLDKTDTDWLRATLQELANQVRQEKYYKTKIKYERDKV